jgi:hypothetical protein
MALSPGGQPDHLVCWFGTKNGVYSVRSGYHLGRVAEERMRGSSSNGAAVTEFWQKVWRVRGPPVVKLFICKAL